MNNVNKKYSVGSLYLAEPYCHCIHKLPLLAFSDVMSSIELNLIFNSKNKSENNYNISKGFKLNLQKRLYISTRSNNKLDIVLEDENGMKHTCIYIQDDCFIVPDYSNSIIRKKQINGIYKYVLEYDNLSQEIFDINGRIETYIDKYNNTLLSYNYDISNHLISVLYRSRQKIELVYVNEQLSAIRYVVNDTVVCTCMLSYNDSGIIVSHYSGVDYHLVVSETQYSAYSCDQYATQINSHSQKVVFIESANCLQFEHYNNNELVNKDTYNILHYNGEYKFDLIEKEDYNGIITRTQFEQDKPVFSYEILPGTEDEQFSYNFFRRNVYMHTPSGLSGYITPNSGLKMTELGTPEKEFVLNLSANLPYQHNVIISGWIKSDTSDDLLVTLTLINQGQSKNIRLPIKDKWIFFAVPFYNMLSNVRFSYSAQEFVELKDVRYTINEKTISSNEYYLCNGATEYSLRDIDFYIIGEDTVVLYPNEVTGKDLIRYFINKTRDSSYDEFYYSGIYEPSLITNVREIKFFDGNNMHTLNEYVLVNRIYRNGFCENIKLECDKTNRTFSVQFCEQDYFVEKEQVFSDKLDLLASTENGIETEYSRYFNGLLSRIQQATGIGTVIYEYDENYTKLLKKIDDLGVVEFTTDDIWGALTKETISKDNTIEMETLFNMTDDCHDLIAVTFGRNPVTSTNELEYSEGKVSKVHSGGLEYNFDYTNSRLSSIVKNGMEIKSYSYTNNNKEKTETFPLSDTTSYSTSITVDNYGRPTLISGCIENTYAVEPYFTESDNHYNLGGANGSAMLSSQRDLKTNQITYFGYENNQVVKAITKQGESVIKTEYFQYDSAGRITRSAVNYNLNGNQKTLSAEISYATSPNKLNADPRISLLKYKINEQEYSREEVVYDALNRIKTSTKNISDIKYKKELVYSGSVIESVVDTKIVDDLETTESSTEYTYDSLGRILSETNAISGLSKTYVYDSIGRLVRENNGILNKTYTYQYDALGNIVSKNTYDYSTGELPSSAIEQLFYTYSSNVPDRLTSFGNKTITYNNQGCPTVYDGKTYTWTAGKLTKIFKGSLASGSEIWNYTYNGNGQRVKKEYAYSPPLHGTVMFDYVTNKTTTFVYDCNGRMLEEQTITNYKRSSSQVTNIVYLYDMCGIVGMVYNGETYYLHSNLQGDVESIYNTSGVCVGTLSYDVFGNVTASNNAVTDNCHIRYRGYYYDDETENYWVAARYYNPQWCRWISPAAVECLDPKSIDGLNLYAYAKGNPLAVSYCSWSFVENSLNGGQKARPIGSTSSSFTDGLDEILYRGLDLGWLVSSIRVGTEIYKSYKSMRMLINHITYFAENIKAFAEDMRLLGASIRAGVLAFNKFSAIPSKLDFVSLALDVMIDLYDNIQKKYSFEKIALSATLTLAKNITLIYVNKGIMYGATTIGSFFGPVGVVVGFVVGAVICFFVDIYANTIADYYIDKAVGMIN